ncbi:hypothetical protein ABZ916_25875 [Streptomyces sp. NPDC046853]|uniref:hypothetical protein n=1 Tax=Streptomyces sp. NPDC046853 TaxID=3154920 RepID=UPI0033C844F1
MSTKFQSEEAKELYYLQADIEAGDSSQGPAWHGCFQLELVILTEDHDGFVWMSKYADSAALNEAWEMVIRTTYPMEEAA